MWNGEKKLEALYKGTHHYWMNTMSPHVLSQLMYEISTKCIPGLKDTKDTRDVTVTYNKQPITTSRTIFEKNATTQSEKVVIVSTRKKIKFKIPQIHKDEKWSPIKRYIEDEDVDEQKIDSLFQSIPNALSETITVYRTAQTFEKLKELSSMKYLSVSMNSPFNIECANKEKHQRCCVLVLRIPPTCKVIPLFLWDFNRNDFQSELLLKTNITLLSNPYTLYNNFQVWFGNVDCS